MRYRQSIFGVAMLFGAIFQTANATGPVSFVALPVMANQAITPDYPMQIKLVNDGDACAGTLTVGGSDKRVQIPFRLNAKEASSLIVYCPTYDVPLPKPENDLRGPGSESFTDISLVSTSKSGPSDDRLTKIYCGKIYGGILSISSHRNGLDYLQVAEPKGSASSSGQSPSLRDTLTNGQSITVLFPNRHIERLVAFDRYKSIYLGNGSKSLTDGEVAALKEYLVAGGQLVFGANPNSAISDPRWLTLIGKSGEDHDVGNGRVVNLGFDPETTTKFKYRVDERLTRSPHISFLDQNLRDDQKSLSSQGGSDPFEVHLPSFAQIAAVLGAYFFLVVPVNYFLLRKIQKPELMWITAPLLAVGFSGLMFRSARGLYNAPASLQADGTIVCQDDIPNAVFSGAFEMFSPSAGTLNLNLKDTIDLDDYQDYFNSNSIGEPQPLPTMVDDGSLNVPQYHSSNLQFREFSIREVFPNSHPIDFKIEKGKDGIYLVHATNRSDKRLSDVTLVAGEFSTAGRVIEPGGTITLAVDEIQKLPSYVYTNLDEPSPQPNVDSYDINLKRSAALIQTEGRVALFGTEFNVPVGPNLLGPHSYRSKVTLECFAPNSLQLP